jgi:threonine/homoserine/homoserine lactone efflux protein
MSELSYRIGDTTHIIVVPAGFVTDFASTPRAIWSVLPPLHRAWRANTVSGAVSPAVSTHGGRRAFAQGLLSNLVNPKIAVFYLALLPQFIRSGDPVLARLLLLASVHVTIELVWLAALSALLSGARIHRALEDMTGAVLIGLGARLAWDRR